MHPRPFLILSATVALSALSATTARADSLQVLGTAVIYAAGPSLPNQQYVAPQSGGTLPISVNVTPGSYLTFTVSSGRTVSIDSGTHYNDADGVGAGVASSSNNGYSGISGITAPGGGYLTGVFTGAIGPNGPAPASLDFTTGQGTSFTSINPLLDQQFFIGDGLTGDGTGLTQTFYIPTGATTLYLGISDACDSHGGPSCYSDNTGSFSVTVSGSPSAALAPEPSSLVLLGTGLLGVAGAARRRFFTR